MEVRRNGREDRRTEPPKRRKSENSEEEASARGPIPTTSVLLCSTFLGSWSFVPSTSHRTTQSQTRRDKQPGLAGQGRRGEGRREEGNFQVGHGTR
jgi:hypothetical protein